MTPPPAAPGSPAGTPAPPAAPARSVSRALPVALRTAAVLAVAAVTVAASATQPPRSAGGSDAGRVAARLVPAVSAQLICPDLRLLPGTLGTTVTVGTATPGDGAVTLGPAAGAGQPLTVLGGGHASATYRGPLTGPLVLRAHGDLTRGLVAEQLSRGNKTGDRGLAEARCEPPRAEQWFVGPGTQPGQTPVLTLANPGDSTAITDVTVYTPGGVSAAPTGHNLALGPRSVTRIPLAALAPGVSATAVQVATATGQVSAAVRDARVQGETLLGTDWVPVATGPSGTVTVAGIPGTVLGQPPARTLLLANPGSADTTVALTVLSAQGRLVPTGDDALVVRAQSVRAVDLSAALGTSAAAVTVTSTDGGAVVAGVLVDAASTRTAIHEITYLGAAAPLQGPALVPRVVINPATDSVLVLTATGAAAVARLTVAGSGGTGALHHDVAVSADHTVAVSLRGLAVPDGAELTVTPLGPGQLLGARIVTEQGALGPLLSAFGLLGAPPLLTAPAVVPAPVGPFP